MSSNPSELSMAFHAIRYMLEVQQGVLHGRVEPSRIQREFPVPADVGKVPLPLTSEISYCIDLAEMAGDFLWDNLLDVQRRRVLLENLIKLNEEKVGVLLLEQKKIEDEKWTKTVNTDIGAENGEKIITEIVGDTIKNTEIDNVVTITKMDVIPSENTIEIRDLSQSVSKSNTKIEERKEEGLDKNVNQEMTSTSITKENLNNEIKCALNLSLLLPCDSNDSIDESEMNIVEKIQINIDNNIGNEIKIDHTSSTTVTDNSAVNDIEKEQKNEIINQSEIASNILEIRTSTDEKKIENSVISEQSKLPISAEIGENISILPNTENTVLASVSELDKKDAPISLPLLETDVVVNNDKKDDNFNDKKSGEDGEGSDDNDNIKTKENNSYNNSYSGNTKNEETNTKITENNTESDKNSNNNAVHLTEDKTVAFLESVGPESLALLPEKIVEENLKEIEDNDLEKLTESGLGIQAGKEVGEIEVFGGKKEEKVEERNDEAMHVEMELVVNGNAEVNKEGMAEQTILEKVAFIGTDIANKDERVREEKQNGGEIAAEKERIADTAKVESLINKNATEKNKAVVTDIITNEKECENNEEFKNYKSKNIFQDSPSIFSAAEKLKNSVSGYRTPRYTNSIILLFFRCIYLVCYLFFLLYYATSIIWN